MKVALVYDRVNKWGGAERVLLALHEIWPEAPLYTAVYDPNGAPWAKVFDVRPSFLTKIPLASTHHELYPWLTPLAFETFNFDGYDAVISVTSAEAKNIITKPGTLHICYCLTPTRYLWSGFERYKTEPAMGELSTIARGTLGIMATTLRKWDLIAASRPDYYLAISGHVEKRIQKYYQRETEKVIYPPVETEKFKIKQEVKVKEPYFLAVSRLVGYKRMDVIIDAFNRLGWPLTVIGDGMAREHLKKEARGNITFIHDYLTEDKLVGYYRNCAALVIAADEDFGLTAVEALASGKPVIAFGDSGVKEVVSEGKTGILFSEQSPESLVEALNKFKNMNFDEKLARSTAEKFSKKRFQKEMKDMVYGLHSVYNRDLRR